MGIAGLRDRVAVVTGGSRGIGKAICLELARAGLHVVVAARTERPSPKLPGDIHATAEAVRALGGRALAVRCDVAVQADVDRLVRQTLDAFGRIDVLVNNAGVVGPDHPFLEMSVEEWDAIMGVNLRGAFLCARAVAPAMVRQGAGVIINISSGAAVRPGFANVPYGVSKAGLDRLTKGLAYDLRGYGIAAISLSAPYTAVERLVRQRRSLAGAQPPEFTARALVWLLAHDPLRFSGQVVTPRQLREELAADI